MKYKFVGLKVPYKGKPIWEIVGNLKNFGVGRVIVEDEHKDNFSQPTFYKIVKVIPSESPKNIGSNRKVLLWAEMVLKGKKIVQLEQLFRQSDLTKFHLIPKDDEVKYWNGVKDTVEYDIIPKFQTWPPLYKIIQEKNRRKYQNLSDPLPPLGTYISEGEKSFEKLSEEDITEEPPKSELYKTQVPVEDLYKEIFMLRRKLGIPDRKEKEK